MGEEYGASDAGGGNGRRWVVDPIDGTKSYVRGIPVWATLLALQEHGELAVAVVSAPAMGRRWWASRGGGAFMRDGLARRSSAAAGVGDPRARATHTCPTPGIEDWENLGRLDAALALARACWRSRSFGDFWAYMLVAEGAIEIALDPVASLWDLAAPQLIVEEAGGRFSDLGGAQTADGGDAIATNGPVHEAAIALVGR